MNVAVVMELHIGRKFILYIECRVREVWGGGCGSERKIRAER